jgi:hypothetical protein
VESVTGAAVPFATTPIKGVAAGLAGGAVMTAVEKAEQAVPGRPSSFVPGRTLAHLLGLPGPRKELVIDVAHKAVYAFATGAVADALIAPAPGSSVTRPWQRLRLSGHA